MINIEYKPLKGSGRKIQLNHKVYNLPFLTKVAKWLKNGQKLHVSNRDFEKSKVVMQISCDTFLE